MGPPTTTAPTSTTGSATTTARAPRPSSARTHRTRTASTATTTTTTRPPRRPAATSPLTATWPAGPLSLTPLVDVPGGTTSYNDTSAASRGLYWYAVTAVNAAGESPQSNLTRMVAR